MYTVNDITELIRHHLVLSTDDVDKADIQLAQLMRNIEDMISTPALARAHLLDRVRGLRRVGVQRAVRIRRCRRVRGRWLPLHRVPLRRRRTRASLRAYLAAPV